MPRTGRRNLLKMLGVSPALLVPWTPASARIDALPASPSPAETEKLTLEEALRRVDWDALHCAQSVAASACRGFSMRGHRHPIVGGQVMGADDGNL